MKKILFLTILVVTIFTAWTPQAEATRLLMSGFESQSLDDEGFSVNTTNLVNTLSTTTSVKRTGTASVSTNASITSGSRNGSRLTFPTVNIASTTSRVYLYVSSYPNTTTSIIAVTNGTPFTTTKAAIKLTAAGKLQLFDNSSQIGSDSSTIPLNTWVRVELKVYISNTSSATIEGKLDGTVFGSSSAANPNGNNASAIAFGINLNAEAATSGSWYFDDFALNNNSGASQTDYPGPGAIVNLYPNAAGDFTEGASNGSGTGWDDIDERGSDADTTYWMIQNNGQRLDVNVTDSATVGIPNDELINVVQVNAIVRNDGSAGSVYNVRMKASSGGTISSGAATTLNSSLWSVNDDGSDKSARISTTTNQDNLERWTKEKIDTMQIGITATDADPDIFVTSMWASVEYAPPPPKARLNLTGGQIKFTGGRINIK